MQWDTLNKLVMSWVCGCGPIWALGEVEEAMNGVILFSHAKLMVLTIVEEFLELLCMLKYGLNLFGIDLNFHANISSGY